MAPSDDVVLSDDAPMAQIPSNPDDQSIEDRKGVRTCTKQSISCFVSYTSRVQCYYIMQIIIKDNN